MRESLQALRRLSQIVSVALVTVAGIVASTLTSNPNGAGVHSPVACPWGSVSSQRSTNPSDVVGLENRVEIRWPERFTTWNRIARSLWKAGSGSLESLLCQIVLAIDEVAGASLSTDVKNRGVDELTMENAALDVHAVPSPDSALRRAIWLPTKGLEVTIAEARLNRFAPSSCQDRAQVAATAVVPKLPPLA
ncbi:MAG: hypothetical protein HY303_05025 [Candidatus Wallbacteria bacterium]|nr:hypothetical protein [Candidatus Wallbacteria bacterium]